MKPEPTSTENAEQNRDPETQPEASTEESKNLSEDPPAETAAPAPAAPPAGIAADAGYAPAPDPAESSDEDLQDEMEQFDALLDQHLPGGGEEVPRGEVIEVPVVDVTEDHVLVDVRGKAEASIPIEEFTLNAEGKPDVEIGQTIKVIQFGRNRDGSPRMSHREARAREAERSIREAKENEAPVTGRIVSTVKGGVMVDIGLQAFMPASQVDLFKIPDLSTMVGQEIKAYVLEFDGRRKRAVLSRRRLLFEERERERREMLEKLEVGQVLIGKVKNALDFGVFLDLGVVDGFIPREEVSWDRGTHPSHIVKSGDEIEVKVVKVDIDAGKVTLSRKRMTDDPWANIDERFPVGGKATGTVIAIQPYGVFVHLEEGVTGMIHASDLSWAPGNKKPGDFVTKDQAVECQVLEVDKEAKKMSLGIKQLEKDPWQEASKKYARGTTVKGSVTSMTNYGAFIRLDDYIEGMVHVSDLSWERRINHPKEVLKAGEEVEAVVLKVDPKQHRISLGIKQLSGSPFDAFLKRHPVGSTVTGKVTRFAPFGAFIELGPGLEGLVHVSQIDEKRVEVPEDVLSVGEEIMVKVVKADERNQKISLSRKEVLRQAERESIKQYMRKNSDDKSSGGMNLFGDALSKAQEQGDEEEEKTEE